MNRKPGRSKTGKSSQIKAPGAMCLVFRRTEQRGYAAIAEVRASHKLNTKVLIGGKVLFLKTQIESLATKVRVAAVFEDFGNDL